MFSFWQDFLMSKEGSKKSNTSGILIWLYDIFDKYQIRKKAIKIVVIKVLLVIKVLVDCDIP